MKKILFLLLAFGFSVSTFAQFNAMMQKKASVVAPFHRSQITNLDSPVVGEQSSNPIVSNKSVTTHPQVSVTMLTFKPTLPIK